MSLTQNTTGALWRSFMPVRTTIKNTVGTDLFAMQLYPPDYFHAFNPAAPFHKYACVEVTDFADVPTDLETYTLPGGLYAIFDYKGLSADPAIFQYIFGSWLPQSGYQLDHRPHVEVLGARYKNNDPESEEEIWIPVRL